MVVAFLDAVRKVPQGPALVGALSIWNPSSSSELSIHVTRALLPVSATAFVPDGGGGGPTGVVAVAAFD